MNNTPIGPPAVPDYPAPWRPVLVTTVARYYSTYPAFHPPSGLAMLLRVECHRDRSFYIRTSNSDFVDMLGIALTMIAADEWHKRQECVQCGDRAVPGLVRCIGCEERATGLDYANPSS
jgi:hypothetical protein